MNTILIDDHLLLRVLLGNEPLAVRAGDRVATTGLWYHRLCRALSNDAIAGSLSRQLGGVDEHVAASVIDAVTELPTHVDVLSLRTLGWPMAQLVASGHRLNLLALEAIAAAKRLSAEIWLSPASADSPLRSAAEREAVPVRIVDLG